MKLYLLSGEAKNPEGKTTFFCGFPVVVASSGDTAAGHAVSRVENRYGWTVDTVRETNRLPIMDMASDWMRKAAAEMTRGWAQ